jgi:formiminotetrahydrofolate cyclodeaminase
LDRRIVTSESDTLGAWLDALAARSPAPSGGAAVAVVLAGAGALAAMVARFSSSRLPDAAEVAAEADFLRHRAFALAAADEDAFLAVLDSPKDTSGTDGGARAGDAFVVATEIPLELLSIASRVMFLLKQLEAGGNPRLRGDALTGAQLARASARSAATLARLNLAGVSERDRGRLLARLVGLEADIDALAGGSWLAPPETVG